MSERKVMQFSQNKKLPQEEEGARQSHSSLDKVEKKLVGTSTPASPRAFQYLQAPQAQRRRSQNPTLGPPRRQEVSRQ
jgi:hypothetical protein